ncbi:hypothetical protein [Nostoc sp.]|uniref:hypothetical protein n=1 Tax=Nostoc sp. TaxID=1180 RepID=UPI002FF0BE99
MSNQSRGLEQRSRAGEERVDRQLVLFPLLLFYLCCPQRKSSLTEGIGSGEKRSLCVTTKISIGRQGNTERSRHLTTPLLGEITSGGRVDYHQRRL